MKLLTKIAAALPFALGLGLAHASGEGFPLDHFPTEKLTDQTALQTGAKLFVNYCMGCHALSSMRFNRLHDIGLNDDEIRRNLIFTGVKVGDQMRIAMSPDDAAAWFGATPPDLSLEARARASESGSGSDWLYTYLRAFYRDASRPTGWNNAVFPNVGMPQVLWQLQGSRGATIEDVRPKLDPKTDEVLGYAKTTTTFDADGQRSEKTEQVAASQHLHEGTEVVLGKAQGGTLTQPEYDEQVADLVAFLTYVSDPTAQERTRLGVWVLLYLAVLTTLAWWLNREYWKDIK